jgi:transcriptional regulator with XRE-family HTH domain
MKDISTSKLRLSQSEVAVILGISRQLLSKWKRDDLLTPSLKSKKDDSGRELRGYAIQDVVAGIFAKTTMEDLGFRGDQLREMVRLMQNLDEEAQRHAYLITVRTRPGMMKHLFMPDDRGDCADAAELLGLDREFIDGGELIEFLEDADRVISKATFFEMTEAILKEVYAKYVEGKLASTALEAT